MNMTNQEKAMDDYLELDKDQLNPMMQIKI